MKKVNPQTKALMDASAGRRAKVQSSRVEIALRNGAAIVLSAEPSDVDAVEELTIYPSRARVWFELEFDQLGLFETDNAGVAHRKMASFAQLSSTPDWIAPVKVEMRYVPPRSTKRRAASHRDVAAIAAAAASPIV